MRKQDIEITISPTGEVSFTIKGDKGASCMDESQFLENALGGGVVEQSKAPEDFEESQGVGASQWATSGEDSDDE